MEKQKKSFRTRVKIMNAYIELMKYKDFDSIKVNAIAAKADITRGTFYLYFSDIYDLTAYIEDYLFSEIPAASPDRTISRDALSPITYEMCKDTTWERSWFEYYKTNKEALNSLLGPHGDELFYKKIKKKLQQTLTVQMHQDSMPEDTYYNYFIHLIPDLYLVLAKEWTSNDRLGSLNIDEIAKISSTIRIGSLYLNHLELVASLKKDSSREEHP